MKRTLIEITAVLVFISGIAYLWDRAKHEKNLRQNIETSYKIKEESVIAYYKAKNDSVFTAQSKTIESNMNTFKTLFNDIREDFESKTGTSSKNLQNAFKTQINTKETFYVPIKDSTDTIKTFFYEDQFNKIEGIVKPDSVKLDIEHSLYLTKYTYRKRNKAPWYKPWKWGKSTYTDVRSNNPNDEIVHIQDIMISK